MTPRRQVTCSISADNGDTVIRAAEALARLAAGYMLDGAEVFMTFGADEEESENE